ncbi:lipoyl synthase [Candidatus Peregrinibacteria bacterium CG_4_9_14_0_2_um_filter_53_11]|nr:MAG: lipoyl synthase [Candidatus Peregrinibacteria bacterium CG_4_9_14_0_2_um_filter_53_11]
MIQLVPGRLRKPDWLKMKVALPNERYRKIRATAQKMNLATVCEEAQCPNIAECWGGGTATFMLMGDTCTRACRFCNVNHGKPQQLDPDEPKNLAEAIGKMGVDYAVITCVDRDDLPDGGAAHFAECIKHLRTTAPHVFVEILTSDYQGSTESAQKVIDASPHVYAHNIETVRRLQSTVRDRRANYEQSLSVLEYVKKAAPHLYTKSSIIVGLGERPEEVIEAMRDLRAIGVSLLTLGQYLRPSAWNLPVVEYVKPEIYKFYEEEGKKMGFDYVAAGPFVRSSYRAGELFVKNVLKTKTHPTN